MSELLENGTYLAVDRAYSSTRKIIVFNGKATIYTPNGVFVCVMTPAEVQESYYKLKKEDKSKRLFNLAWMINGEIKELVVQNVSYAVCKHKKNFLDRTNQYKPGILMPVQSVLS